MCQKQTLLIVDELFLLPGCFARHHSLYEQTKRFAMVSVVHGGRAHDAMHSFSPHSSRSGRRTNLLRKSVTRIFDASSIGCDRHAVLSLDSCRLKHPRIVYLLLVRLFRNALFHACSSATPPKQGTSRGMKQPRLTAVGYKRKRKC